MKKIFKTVALTTAIAVGAATMTGCPNPVMPENDTEQVDDEEQDNETPETPTPPPTTNPQTQVLRLATSFNDMSADLRPVKIEGLQIDGHGFPNVVRYEIGQFEEGRTYEIEGVVGRDFLLINGNGNNAINKQIHIRSKNVAVQIINAGTGTTVHVEMPLVPGPLPTSPTRPQAPFHSFNAASAVRAASIGGTRTGYKVTGTKGLWVMDSPVLRQLP